ncbi:hypothetical protein P692DRAFT_20824371 [Suillus brevipes Sb2]|nr:hypothetical protein P692DRAFT_20824371 [Suillus brevipes Sb2]
MSSPDAVLRSLLAVVLTFFLLMDPSLLVFSPLVFCALQRQDEPSLPWRRSQTHPHFATCFTLCENVRCSAVISVQPFPVPSSGFR